MGKLTETNIIEGNGFRLPKILDESENTTYLYDCVTEPNNIIWFIFDDVYSKETFIIGVLYDNRNVTSALKQIIDEVIHCRANYYDIESSYDLVRQSDMRMQIMRYINDISDFDTDNYYLVHTYIMPLSVYKNTY